MVTLLALGLLTEGNSNNLVNFIVSFDSAMLGDAETNEILGGSLGSEDMNASSVLSGLVSVEELNADEHFAKQTQREKMHGGSANSAERNAADDDNGSSSNILGGPKSDADNKKALDHSLKKQCLPKLSLLSSNFMLDVVEDSFKEEQDEY